MATASSSASRVDQTNDGGDTSLRGCVRVAIEVTPATGDTINDVHLQVAITKDETGSALISEGDPLNQNYQDDTTLPAGWVYDEMIADAGPQGRTDWYLTWRNDGGGPLAENVAQEFVVFYCGLKAVKLSARNMLLLTNDGNTDPDTGIAGRHRAHVPTR